MPVYSGTALCTTAHDFYKKSTLSFMKLGIHKVAIKVASVLSYTLQKSCLAEADASRRLMVSFKSFLASSSLPVHRDKQEADDLMRKLGIHMAYESN